MPTRFRDDETQPGVVVYPILVQCPRCQRRAEIVVVDPPAQDDGETPQHGWRTRLVCPACGHTADGFKKYAALGAPGTDFFSGLPLWLQVPCAGHLLWAWNESHLDFIERYVAADLRERTPNINKSLASRLPAWIKSGKNRDEVLKGIRRLRKRLAETNASR